MKLFFRPPFILVTLALLFSAAAVAAAYLAPLPRLSRPFPPDDAPPPVPASGTPMSGDIPAEIPSAEQAAADDSQQRADAVLDAARAWGEEAAHDFVAYDLATLPDDEETLRTALARRLCGEEATTCLFERLGAENGFEERVIRVLEQYAEAAARERLEREAKRLPPDRPESVIKVYRLLYGSAFVEGKTAESLTGGE